MLRLKYRKKVRYEHARELALGYHYLNVFGLTPWIALHLFYIMILVLFSWMNANGFAADALAVCGGLFARLSWFIPASEVLKSRE